MKFLLAFAIVAMCLPLQAEEDPAAVASYDEASTPASRAPDKFLSKTHALCKIDWTGETITAPPGSQKYIKKPFDLYPDISKGMSKFYKDNCSKAEAGELSIDEFLANAYSNCKSFCSPDADPVRVCNSLCDSYIQRTQGFISGYRNAINSISKNCGGGETRSKKQSASK